MRSFRGNANASIIVAAKNCRLFVGTQTKDDERVAQELHLQQDNQGFPGNPFWLRFIRSIAKLFVLKLQRVM